MDGTNMTNVIETTRKIGENRGKPRLWIEGRVLLEAGLKCGDAWQIYKDETGFWHIVQGDAMPNCRVRKIAGTASRPIIDMSGATVSTMGFKSGDTAGLLIFRPGCGIITLTKESGE